MFAVSFGVQDSEEEISRGVLQLRNTYRKGHIMTQYKATHLRSLLGGIGIAALFAAAISTGAQTAGTHTKKPASHSHTKLSSHAKISAAQARTIALKKYPGTVEGKIVLENEDGSWQYAVNIRSGKTLREVMVSASSGKIASMEVTTKAEEAKELKAETAKPKATHTTPKNTRTK